MKEDKLKKLNYELLELYKKSMPILIRSWKNESKRTDRNVKNPEKDILLQVTQIPDYEYTWFYVSPRKYNEIASDDKVEVIDTY